MSVDTNKLKVKGQAPKPLSRGVLDPEIAKGIEELLAEKDATKESAVKHARHWVRLTRLCNQRCIFCLDSWNHNGTYIDTEQLYQYIDLGAQLGRERLILSGGEPTIHPDYIKFIRRGKRAGYDWVQTVTNGMMFAYPEFTRRCVRAGLDEVTISIHGHTPKLQDKLVGVPGAFDKAIAGIRNIQALSRGRTVVNIDVVINKQNVPYLREIVDFFRGDFGIHEFDLLYIVPFGRGFAEYRSQLYFDIEDHFDDLQRAFEVSKEPGVYLWTNRLPVEYLENYEHLIQDPHKLHSEVQGGLHNFEGFLKLGVPPDCHGERCPHCFLQGLCADQMFHYREMLTDGTFQRVRVDLETQPASEVAAMVFEMQRPEVAHVAGPDPASVRAWAADQPFEDARLVAEPAEGAADLLSDATFSRVVVSMPDALEAALAVAPAAGAPDLQVTLDARTAEILLGEAAAPWIAAGKLIAHLDNHEYVSAVRKADVPPATLAALREAGLRLMNVPRCVAGEGSEPGGHDELALDMLDAQGNLGVTPYVQRYVMGEYYKKSRRCGECAFADSCRGMHINYLRAYGFSTLQPIRAEG